MSCKNPRGFPTFSAWGIGALGHSGRSAGWPGLPAWAWARGRGRGRGRGMVHAAVGHFQRLPLALCSVHVSSPSSFHHSIETVMEDNIGQYPGQDGNHRVILCEVGCLSIQQSLLNLVMGCGHGMRTRHAYHLPCPAAVAAVAAVTAVTTIPYPHQPHQPHRRHRRHLIITATTNNPPVRDGGN